MTLAALRTLVRHDLRDTDPADRRWTDDELDRHLRHAVDDLSRAAPRETAAVVGVVAGSRDVSLSALSGLIDVEGIEYPVNRVPTVFAPFSRWGSAVTLLTEAPPVAGAQLRVYYTAVHTLNDAGSTVPAHLEEAVAAGAAGYAALAWAAYAANRVTVGGADTAKRYRAWGNDRLEAFQRALGRAAMRRGVRVRHMYPAGDPGAGRLRVTGA